MRRDPRVMLLGQDIAEYGGAFKVTEGFVEEFGKARVRNTPIIESGGARCRAGPGARRLPAHGGDAVRRLHHLRLQPDRQQPGQDALPLGRAACRWCMRVPVGGGMGAGPFHSQNLEAWFTHVAGLKVVAPATPADAKGLLLAAFEDGNPVLYLEHKLLIDRRRGACPQAQYTLPIGPARVAREGRDATIVT